MLKNVIRTVTAGAVVLLTAGVAAAQSPMKIDVPFSFGTPTAHMPAGEYVVSVLPGNQAAPFYRLTHMRTGTSSVVIAPQMVTRDAQPGGLPAQVRFQCIGEYCALSQIYPRGQFGGHGVNLKRRPAHPDVAAGHAVVIAAR